jgi:hypothetical protein
MTEIYVPPHDFPAPRGPAVGPRLTGIVIAALATLVFTASYFAGRAARPAEDARVRVAVAPAPAAAPEETTVAAPVEEPIPPGPFDGFDLALLHSQVADAVVGARVVRENAVAAERRAEAAARLARAGAPGAGVILYDAGDVYAGELRNGGRHGVGVYTWANPQEDDYAGEFVDDVMDGLGVKRWADGATYYGDRRRDSREGYGVFADVEGGGYEGAWRNGAPDGYGVVWNADGTVRAQGLWAGNTLIEAWVIPTPVATEDGLVVEDAGEVADEP